MYFEKTSNPNDNFTNDLKGGQGGEKFGVQCIYSKYFRYCFNYLLHMNDSLKNDITDMLCYSASIKLLTVVIMCVIQQYHRTHTSTPGRNQGYSVELL